MLSYGIRIGLEKALESRIREKKEAEAKIGKYNQHGEKIETTEQAKNAGNTVYATQDEALDRRYSKGEEKLDKRRPSIFGNARANIFGN